MCGAGIEPRALHAKWASTLPLNYTPNLLFFKTESHEVPMLDLDCVTQAGLDLAILHHHVWLQILNFDFSEIFELQAFCITWEVGMIYDISKRLL